MDLNKIITEEFNSLLNESYVLKDDKFKFKQIVPNCTFQNYESFTSEFDTKITENNILINWSIGFWLNESGVENLLIEANSVEGTYKIEYLNRQSDKLEQETQKEIGENNWKFMIDEAAGIQKGGSLYVLALNFDFETNTCTVKF